MKIWHLLSNRWNSAITEYAVSAVKANIMSGHEVHASVLTGSPAEFRMRETIANVSAVDGFGPGKYAGLMQLCRQISPEVIVTHGGPETTAAHFFKGNARLIRVYGYAATEKSPFSMLAQYMGHSKVDQIIAPSEAIALGLRSLKGKGVSVVALGCDDKKFYPDSFPGCEDRDIVIFGRLDPVKGHREFMPVFKALYRKALEQNIPTPFLRITGLPANISKSHLEQSAAQVGLRESDFSIDCERVENVARFMSTTRVGVVSSLGSEAICRVAQEFLLCGTPIVSTTAGSLPDVFRESLFGQTFSGKPDECADRILEVYKKSLQETAQDRKNRASAAQRYFSLDAMAKSLDEILKNRT